MSQWTRKQFLTSLGWTTVSGTMLMPCRAEAEALAALPTYLRGYEAQYQKNPREAAVQWHRDARWGLFVHYALASLRGLTAKSAIESKDKTSEEWKALKRGTSEEYTTLRDRFTAEKFDADFITDLALAAEMRYVNFTTRHLGDLYMFRTSVSEFTSLKSPARRDLVAELALQCEKKGLGLFLYCPPDVARTEPQETYDRNCTVIRELLTQYGPIAGIWLDGVGSYYEEPQAYARIKELYALIRSLQPQCLISFKQGTGAEDFVAPEGLMHTKKEAIAQKAWALNAGKRGDICTNMQTTPPAWIYMEGCEHINADQVLGLLADAFAQNANLTLNTGPLPDGSIHPADVASLREAGERIRKHGFPEPQRMDRAERNKLKGKHK